MSKEFESAIPSISLKWWGGVGWGAKQQACHTSIPSVILRVVMAFFTLVDFNTFSHGSKWIYSFPITFPLRCLICFSCCSVWFHFSLHLFLTACSHWVQVSDILIARGQNAFFVPCCLLLIVKCVYIYIY